MGLPRCLDGQRLPLLQITRRERKKNTYEVSTVGVHFASKVVRLNINLALVNETDDLGIGRGPHELNTLKGITRDQTSATTGLGAPCNHLAFSVGDDRIRLARCPKTEVIDAVDEGSLAEGLLVLGGGVTNVVAMLETTDETLISVDHIRLPKSFI
jgi:hypothetical protein